MITRNPNWRYSFVCRSAAVSIMSGYFIDKLGNSCKFQCNAQYRDVGDQWSALSYHSVCARVLSRLSSFLLRGGRTKVNGWWSFYVVLDKLVSCMTCSRALSGGPPKKNAVQDSSFVSCLHIPIYIRTDLRVWKLNDFHYATSIHLKIYLWAVCQRFTGRISLPSQVLHTGQQ